MSEPRLPDYLDHIREAAANACEFVQGWSKEDFLQDKRTQQAVIMSLIIIGEAGRKLMEGHAEFIKAHPEVPWHNIRGMRNRIVHAYFQIDFDMVWATLQTELPDLLKMLPRVRQDAEAEVRDMKP